MNKSTQTTQTAILIIAVLAGLAHSAPIASWDETIAPASVTEAFPVLEAPLKSGPTMEPVPAHDKTPRADASPVDKDAYFSFMGRMHELMNVIDDGAHKSASLPVPKVDDATLHAELQVAAAVKTPVKSAPPKQPSKYGGVTLAGFQEAVSKKETKEYPFGFSKAQWDRVLRGSDGVKRAATVLNSEDASPPPPRHHWVQLDEPTEASP